MQVGILFNIEKHHLDIKVVKIDTQPFNEHSLDNSY